MWLPDKLYEMLPYLYVAGGFFSATYFDSPVGYGSGFLLLMTAGLVWMMRRDYRQGRTERKN